MFLRSTTVACFSNVTPSLFSWPFGAFQLPRRRNSQIHCGKTSNTSNRNALDRKRCIYAWSLRAGFGMSSMMQSMISSTSIVWYSASIVSTIFLWKYSLHDSPILPLHMFFKFSSFKDTHYVASGTPFSIS